MNFGIIGFGVMGRIRFNVLKDWKGHSVTKIYDPVLLDIPSSVKIAKNYRDVVEDKKIDAIIICVPNYLSHKYVVETLQCGKHVFCEKPPGINAEEVLSMKKEEKKNPSLKLMFGFNHRHHESVIEAKRIIDSGQYGNILWLRGRYGKSVSPDFEKNWRSRKEFAGGGILIDQGTHMVDLFLMLCGDFQEVQAFVSNLYWKSDIEDNVFAIFRNKNGQMASLHSTMTQWRHLFSLEMFLEKGYITINGLLTTSGSYGREEMTIAENRTTAPVATWTREERIIFNVNSSWKRELELFIEAIEHDTPVPSGNTEDALKLMRLIDRIYEQR